MVFALVDKFMVAFNQWPLKALKSLELPSHYLHQLDLMQEAAQSRLAIADDREWKRSSETFLVAFWDAFVAQLCVSASDEALLLAAGVVNELASGSLKEPMFKKVPISIMFARATARNLENNIADFGDILEESEAMSRPAFRCLDAGNYDDNCRQAKTQEELDAARADLVISVIKAFRASHELFTESLRML